MAIKPYKKNNQTCYLLKCTARGKTYGTETRRQKDLGAVTLSEARRQHRILEKEVKQICKSKSEKGITWKKILTHWFNKVVLINQSNSRTEIDNYNTLLRYTNQWDSLSLDSITIIDFKILVNSMTEQGLSRSRIKAVRSAINVVYDWAYLNRYIDPRTIKPTLGVSLPKGKSKKQPILNRVEIKQLLKKAKEQRHPFYPIWVMAFNTGCRSGELWALKWSDIDLERKLISITKSYSQRLNIIKDTKTCEWRDIPINRQLEAILKELKIKDSCNDFVLPRINSWRRGNAAAILRDFCKAIGIREINFHATRACFAVQCLESGIDVATTMKLGGWSSMKAFQHYIRLAGVEIKGATDALDLQPTLEHTQNVVQISSYF